MIGNKTVIKLINNILYVLYDSSKKWNLANFRLINYSLN